jgi:hypothetical protein
LSSQFLLNIDFVHNFTRYFVNQRPVRLGQG